jgi:hypothetical protein
MACANCVAAAVVWPGEELLGVRLVVAGALVDRGAEFG